VQENAQNYMTKSSIICSLLNITRIRVLKLRRMKRYVAFTGFWFGRLEGRYHMEDIGLDGKTVLNWILKWV
jgi:hypothetical protein